MIGFLKCDLPTCFVEGDFIYKGNFKVKHEYVVEQHQSKVIREAVISDSTGEIEVTMWDNATVNCNLQLGSRICISDSMLSFNSVKKHVYISLTKGVKLFQIPLNDSINDNIN